MVNNDVLGGAFVLLVTLGVVVGLPVLVTDWLRQRRAARERQAYLDAWTNAQERSQEAFNASQLEGLAQHKRSVELQARGLDQSREINERFLAVHARRIELAEQLVNESKKTTELLAEAIRLMGPMAGRAREES